jgi:hypothetical protein
MLLSIILLCLADVSLAIVARAPDPAAAAVAGDVCKSGIYAKLSPLASYSPGKTLCAKKYPQTTTIIVAAKMIKRNGRTTTKSTTTKPASTTIAKTTSATTTKYTQCDLVCLFSLVVGSVEKTSSLTRLA